MPEVVNWAYLLAPASGKSQAVATRVPAKTLGKAVFVVNNCFSALPLMLLERMVRRVAPGFRRQGTQPAVMNIHGGKQVWEIS